MATLKSSLIGLLILISSLRSAAQTDREIVTQSAEWFALTSAFKVHKNVSILTEGQFRYVGGFEPQQFQFRIAPEISLPKNFFLIPIGYVYTWNPIYGEQPSHFSNNENRIWEQVTYKHDIGKRIHVSHRLRLEQRMIQYHTPEGEYEGYSIHTNRLRYRFNANIPLNHAKMDPNTYYIALYDEVFISWGDPVTYDKPDQNRIFAGAGYQATKLFSFQGGFFYQMLVKKNGLQQENNIGFQMQVNYNFDFTKREN